MRKGEAKGIRYGRITQCVISSRTALMEVRSQCAMRATSIEGREKLPVLTDQKSGSVKWKLMRSALIVEIFTAYVDLSC